MKNIRQTQSGFTLLEILMAVFLGMILIIAGYSVYLASYKSYKYNSESAELTQNARVALERMSREIRQSQEIIIPATLPPDENSPTQNTIVFQDGHTVFSTPSPDPNCAIQYIRYTISSGNLTRTIIQYKDPTQGNICVQYNPANPAITTNELPEEIKAEKLSQLKFWGTSSLVSIFVETTNGETTEQFLTQTSPRN